LLAWFHGYPLAGELRHRSWSDSQADTLALLGAFGAAFVQIDEPKFRLSIRQNYLPNVTSFYYMRLHGRNVAKWRHHDKTEDRYDYLYSGKELQEFSDIAGAANALVKKSYLYTYHHFASKSELYREAYSHKVEQTIDVMNSRLEGIEPRRRFVAMVEAFHDLFTGDRTLLLLMQRDVIDASVTRRQFLSRQQYDHFTSLIRRTASEMTGAVGRSGRCPSWL
jgi:hypothetical protein